FVPSGCKANLPVMQYTFDPKNNFTHSQIMGMSNNLVWCSEYFDIVCGNKSDTSADLTGIPENGDFVKCQITLDKIKMNSMEQGTMSVRAEIADLKLL
ncbi:MAG: hypothetical protein K2N56_07570, partial [Oscillospiraceae bacterium]|nr:hypothetical protein [Oscillospiraceae bacterium]